MESTVFDQCISVMQISAKQVQSTTRSHLYQKVFQFIILCFLKQNYFSSKVHEVRVRHVL